MRRFKNVIPFFLFTFILVLQNVNNVSAESPWDQINVDSQKEWKIKFNMEIDETTVNEKNIYVKNDSEEIVDDIKVYINEDNISATVEAPLKGYNLGNTYTLIVTTNVQSINNQALQNEVRMYFTIKKDQTDEILEDLVTLPSSEYDVLEAEKMLTRISQIPDKYLYNLVQKNIEIRLVKHQITNEPEWSNLKGVVPRGWEGTGKTWDDVPGVGGSSPTIVRIGYSDFNKGHGTLNLELHEIAHTIDYQLFNRTSGSDKFKEILSKEVQNLIKDHPNAYNINYFYYPEEYFAECFVYYYLNDERKNELKQKAPLTYQYFEQLENTEIANKTTIMGNKDYLSESSFNSNFIVN